MILLVMLLVLITLVFMIINVLYKRTSYYKNLQIDARQFLDGMPYGLSIVNTGSTYSKYAFGAYKELGLAWGDFSLQSQSLEMDKAILGEYINHLEPGGIVVVTVAACVFLYKELGTNEKYGLILKKEHDLAHKKCNMLKLHFPIVFHLKSILKILDDDIEMETIYDSCPTNIDCNCYDEELFNLVKLWERLFKLDDLKHTNFSEENERIMARNVEYLKDIISICLDNKKLPIIVVPPFSKRLNQHISEEFKGKVLNSNVEKAISGRDILFLDYQNDGYFQDRENLFVDGGFRLNMYGSKVFIKRLLSDLVLKGVNIKKVQGTNED